MLRFRRFVIFLFVLFFFFLRGGLFGWSGLVLRGDFIRGQGERNNARGRCAPDEKRRPITVYSNFRGTRPGF